MYYNREQHYKFDYEVNGTTKTCYPKTEQKKDENLRVCEKMGYKVIKVTKLYPFSTNKNQHNFQLVMDKCFNIMHDMEVGTIPFNEKEYNRLYDLKEKAEKLFCLPIPIAWIDGETLKDAKYISNLAIEFRKNTCIKNGRLDLLQYC